MVDVFERVGLDEWPDLPATRMEVEAIGSLFDDASVITGRDVNEAGIRQASRSGSLAGFRFLHFAVHGIVVAAIPQLSALVLSSASTRQGDSDDYLMAHEIARLSLASDAVILSACETGLGRIYPGEGVVGLTHAFLTAGSRGVTSSLWQIADESTKDFMVAVYTHMAADKTPFHRALARVKRSFIRGDITPATSTGTDSRHESYRHPFFWAPFVYFGD
jgi:CHAT domain-containing protein